MRDDIGMSEIFRKIEDGQPKEIKVKVTQEYHRKLYGYKVIEGKTLSCQVTEALDQYFRGIEND